MNGVQKQKAIVEIQHSDLFFPGRMIDIIRVMPQTDFYSDQTVPGRTDPFFGKEIPVLPWFAAFPVPK